jgi:hydroxypyruvate reductase
MTTPIFSPASTLRSLVDAGIAAVAPDGAVLRHLHLDGAVLRAAGHAWNLADYQRVLVLGAGKGAAPMAAALESLLGGRITDGLVIVKHDHGLPLARIRLAEAAHPVPDQACMEAATEIVRMAASAARNDLVICLFTGGASALTPALCPEVSLDDLRTLTGLLLECGADIHEINTVRKHLSAFSGGRLIQAAAPAPALSLIVSDVVGDNLDVIASGPTVPDTSTFADCAAIMDTFALWPRLPASIRDRLRQGLDGRIAETPKPGDPVFANVATLLVASISQALEAAAREAEARGCVARILRADMIGEARDQAAEFVSQARQAAETLRPGDPPLCLLAGGETTGPLRGKGLGGRNQEMALAATLLLDNDPRIAMVFAGTDGTDGPTDAAGGFADGFAAGRARQTGLDLAALLDDNDSHHALDALGTLLRTGPTRTNVMDMAIALMTPEV